MNERQERKNYKDAKKLDDLHRANRDKFIQIAMTTREGRDYMYWLLEICKVGQQPFSGNALTTAFQCGELNVGQQIQAHIVEVAPNSFLTMLTEREEERKANDSRKQRASGEPDPDSGDTGGDEPDTTSS